MVSELRFIIWNCLSEKRTRPDFYLVVINVLDDGDLAPKRVCAQEAKSQ